MTSRAASRFPALDPAGQVGKTPALASRGGRPAVIAVLIVASAWAWTVRRDRATAEGLRSRLANDPPGSPASENQADGQLSRAGSTPNPHTCSSTTPATPNPERGVLLALLPSEPDGLSELIDRLLTCGPEEHKVLREALGDRGRTLSSVAQGLERAPVR